MRPQLLILTFLVLAACTKAPQREKNVVAEEVVEAPRVDTIVISEKEDKEDNFESIYDVHERFLPLVDSIIALHRLYDSLNLWTLKDTFNTTHLDLSTEGSELRVYKNDSMMRYEFYMLGEMGRLEDFYYFNKDSIVLFVNTQIQYNRPIYWDSAMMIENKDTQVFGSEPFESFTEDSYLKHHKIIYQVSEDFGAPNATEYVLEVEKNIFKTLDMLNEIVNSDTLNH
jgi:hypothetical protein